MKIRNGFVSNSSSSSFIIGIKNTTLKKALEELKRKELEKTELFSEVISDCIDIIKLSAREFNDNYVREEYNMTMDDYFRDFGEEADVVKELTENEFKVYVGSFSNDNGPIEAMLCDADLIYESENLVIIHEGGY
jgi:hypothetical protein